MFQCIKYEDKREVFGLKIHSFSTLDRIKKYDDSDNEKNAEKPSVFVDKAVNQIITATESAIGEKPNCKDAMG